MIVELFHGSSIEYKICVFNFRVYKYLIFHCFIDFWRGRLSVLNIVTNMVSFSGLWFSVDIFLLQWLLVRYRYRTGTLLIDLCTFWWFPWFVLKMKKGYFFDWGVFLIILPKSLRFHYMPLLEKYIIPNTKTAGEWYFTQCCGSGSGSKNDLHKQKFGSGSSLRNAVNSCKFWSMSQNS